MPNPLILTSIATKAVGNPEAQQREPRSSDGAQAFQDILDNVPGDEFTHPGGAEKATVDISSGTEAEVSETDTPELEHVAVPTPESDMPVEVYEISLPQPGTAHTHQNNIVEETDIQTRRNVVIVTEKPEHGTPQGFEDKPISPTMKQTEPVHLQGQASGTQQLTPQCRIAEHAVFMRAIQLDPARKTEMKLVPEGKVADPTPPAPPLQTQTLSGNAEPASPPQTRALMNPKTIQSEEQIEISHRSDEEGIVMTKGDTPLQSLRETSPGHGSVPARAEVARAIAGQMAAAISSRPGQGGVEIALNPEELGRVSIILNGREDGLHLTIAAERPETLDLMRRHIAILSVEFQKLGYDDLSFDLGSSGDAPWQENAGDEPPSFDTSEAQPEPDAIANPSLTGPVQGLDMRL